MPSAKDVQSDIDRLKAALLQHGELETPFGRFALRVYEAYEGRNPMTGAIVHVPKKTLPFLKIGSSFYRDVIGGEDAPHSLPPRRRRPGERRTRRSRS